MGERQQVVLYLVIIFTCAHKTLPFGTLVEVTNPDNGRKVIVQVNDRGPYHGDRVLDLSHQAAKQIGLVNDGVARIEAKVLKKNTVSIFLPVKFSKINHFCFVLILRTTIKDYSFLRRERISW
ncbi:MAG: septal ring lytic transglycosylase RlpA family protein [Cytophagaceae bacterium]|nr:septal ring lytic transglycosylase RlpA family protein [Cytophagaceae bacterium]